MARWLAVDLGGTKTALGLVDDDQGLLTRTTFATQADQGPRDWLERLGRNARDLLEKTGGDAPGGLGVGSPGTLDRRQGMIRFSPNLAAFNRFPLVEEISRTLDMPVALENDANVYALGELHFGVGRGRQSLALFTLGTGVGGGLILDGHLVTGPLGSGGELGHMVVEPDGRVCGCGARGCVEAYASATGLKGQLADALASGRATSLASQDDPETMAQAARRGDALAREMFVTAGRSLGRAMAILVAACGLDFFVLGGGLTPAWDQLMRPAARAELSRRLYIADAGQVAIELSVLGGDAPLLGAAALIRAKA